MPATLEMELNEKLQEEINTYLMPKPARGQAVIWFPNADRGNPGEVCFVLKVGHRNIDLRPASGLPRTAVFHVDDPRLRQSDIVREGGAWDFCEKDKADNTLKAEVAELRERVATLEGLLTEPAKKGK